MSGPYLLPKLCLAAMTVGVVWCCLTGAVWQFFPIVGGIVVALGVAKAMNSSGGKAAKGKSK